MTWKTDSNSHPEASLFDDLFSLFYGYGLDFGTYRSMMACKSTEEPFPLAAPYETPSTRGGVPSLFWYSARSNREYLCEEVADYNGLSDDPAGICSSIKMKLDEPFVTLHGKQFSTADIAEKEIRRILSVSHQALEKSLFSKPAYHKLVVGVPVRFGAAKRQTLLQILERASDGKEIVLLPEPIAAALTYSHYARKTLEKVLVFDLGAGTFDTVLLVPNLHRTDKHPYEYKALCPDGLTLAGDFFDSAMAELILDALHAHPGNLDPDRLSVSGTADHQKLLHTARQVKEQLSSAESCSAFIEGTDVSGRPGIQKVIITRKDFERKIFPALQQCVDCAARVLDRAGESTNPQIEILLTGGSSYIPLVRTLLEQKFPHLAKDHILQRFPEQAVALGCALYANRQLSDTPVAYAYALRVRLPGSGQQKLKVQIPSNAPLPFQVSGTYTTHSADQTSARFAFFEVENGAANSYLELDDGNPTSLVIQHHFSHPVPAGTQMLLTMTLTPNGTLMVVVDDHGISPVTSHSMSLADLRHSNDT